VRLLADVTIRSSVMLLLGLAACALLRRRSAAVRHFVLAAAVFAAGAVAPLGMVLPAWDLPVAATAPAASDAAADTPETAVAVTAADTAERHVSPVSLLAAAWAAGALIFLAVLLSGVGRLLWIASRGRTLTRGIWAQAAEEMCAGYGLWRGVRIVQTDAPDLLATWGLFRPLVLLPAGAREWRAERVRVVLRHELAHIRRHDWVI
jgi:beta-lactamase regulating signal transducer with metallopeptidase domain